MQIMCIIYFVGNIWFILVLFQDDLLYRQRQYHTHSADSYEILVDFRPESMNNFVENSNWIINGQKTSMETLIISMYFAMTSLSTVGFGDYYPRNNYERLFGSIILLSGVTIFSFVMAKLQGMIINFGVMSGENSDNQEIEDFFVLIKKFNHGFPLKKELQQEIRDFMELKQHHDKNNFLKTQNDQLLLIQLPQQMQTEIYTDFLFKDFLWEFRRLFRFSCQNLASFSILSMKKKGKKGLSLGGNGPANKNKKNKNNQQMKEQQNQDSDDQKSDKQNKNCSTVQYPFFTFKHGNYCNFMINLMNKLEIRVFKPNHMIAREMDGCMEVLFVQRGLYKVGYEINNQKFFRRRFGMFTVIGGFQFSYDMRFHFYYKTINELRCLAIRKEYFKNIFDEHPEFRCQLKNKFWSHYSQQVYQPLIKAKNMDLLDFNFRDDFNQVLCSKDKQVQQNLVKECIKLNLDELGFNINDSVNKLIDVNNMILNVEKKLPHMAHRGLKIHQQAEKLYTVLLQRLKVSIAQSNEPIDDFEEFIQYFYHMIVPLKLRTQIKLFEIKNFEEFQFQERLFKLKRVVQGNNPYFKCKQSIFFKNIMRNSIKLEKIGLILNKFQDMYEHSQNSSSIQQEKSESSSNSNQQENQSKKSSLSIPTSMLSEYQDDEFKDQLELLNFLKNQTSKEKKDHPLRIPTTYMRIFDEQDDEQKRRSKSSQLIYDGLKKQIQCEHHRAKHDLRLKKEQNQQVIVDQLKKNLLKSTLKKMDSIYKKHKVDFHNQQIQKKDITKIKTPQLQMQKKRRTSEIIKRELIDLYNPHQEQPNNNNKMRPINNNNNIPNLLPLAQYKPRKFNATYLNQNKTNCTGRNGLLVQSSRLKNTQNQILYTSNNENYNNQENNQNIIIEESQSSSRNQSRRASQITSQLNQTDLLQQLQIQDRSDDQIYGRNLIQLQNQDILQINGNAGSQSEFYRSQDGEQSANVRVEDDQIQRLNQEQAPAIHNRNIAEDSSNHSGQLFSLQNQQPNAIQQYPFDSHQISQNLQNTQISVGRTSIQESGRPNLPALNSQIAMNDRRQSMVNERRTSLVSYNNPLSSSHNIQDEKEIRDAAIVFNSSPIDRNHENIVPQERFHINQMQQLYNSNIRQINEQSQDNIDIMDHLEQSQNLDNSISAFLAPKNRNSSRNYRQQTQTIPARLSARQSMRPYSSTNNRSLKKPKVLNTPQQNNLISHNQNITSYKPKFIQPIHRPQSSDLVKAKAKENTLQQLNQQFRGGITKEKINQLLNNAFKDRFNKSNNTSNNKSNNKRSQDKKS